MSLERSNRRSRVQLPRLGQVVAGWRLVRALDSTEDARGEFVGVCEIPLPGSGGGSRHWQGFDSERQPELQHRRVVVAVGETETSALARECSLRDELCSEFVSLAEETLTEGDIRIAIFPLAQLRPWQSLITTNAKWPPGTAVTMLVPLAETIQLAHVAGFAHGDLGLAACFIDDEGRPWIDKWGSTVDLGALSSARADIARSNDLRALGRIADAVLNQCSANAAEPLARLVGGLQDGVTPSDSPARLIDALFQWAEPAAIPASAAEYGDATEQGPVEVPAAQSSGDDRRLDTTDPIETLLGEDDSPAVKRKRVRPSTGRGGFESVVAELKSRASSIRPAYWLAAVAAGAVTVGAGFLLSVPSGSEAEPSGGAPVPGVEELEVSVSEPPTPTPEPLALEAKDATDAPVAPETSIAAVAPLVAARNECFTQEAPECLSALYSPDAPGLAQDLALLDEPDNSAWVIDSDTWVLAADLGDIELLRADGDRPVSLSLERGPAGWLIRELWFPEDSLG